MLFIGYENCSTCQKYRKALDEKKIDYELRDIKKNRPSAEELKKWHEDSGLDIGKFYNTSGKLYREKGLKDKRKEMSLEEQYDLLATDGMLVKRPILVDGKKILVGREVGEFIDQL